MQQEMLSFSMRVLLSLDKDNFTEIVRAILRESKPEIAAREDTAKEYKDVIALLQAELDKVWAIIDAGQIAHILRQDFEDCTRRDTGAFVGMSMGTAIITSIEGIIESELEYIVDESFGPGEAEFGYAVVIDLLEPENIFSDDGDDDEEDEEEVYDGTPESIGLFKLGAGTWREVDFLPGMTLEVTGENVEYHDHDGEKMIIIPLLLKLMQRARTAPIGEWFEHVEGWRCRLINTGDNLR